MCCLVSFSSTSLAYAPTLLSPSSSLRWIVLSLVFFLFCYLPYLHSLCFVFFFFFSSRRRHTRYIGDWSSDVCSSDLPEQRRASLYESLPSGRLAVIPGTSHAVALEKPELVTRLIEEFLVAPEKPKTRSEERRVGKECRYRWWPKKSKKKRKEVDEKSA